MKFGQTLAIAAFLWGLKEKTVHVDLKNSMYVNMATNTNEILLNFLDTIKIKNDQISRRLLSFWEVNYLILHLPFSLKLTACHILIFNF